MVAAVGVEGFAYPARERDLVSRIAEQLGAHAPSCRSVSPDSCALNRAATDAGLDASNLVKQLLSGRGGGSKDMAQGGGIPPGTALDVLAGVPRPPGGPLTPRRPQQADFLHRYA